MEHISIQSKVTDAATNISGDERLATDKQQGIEHTAICYNTEGMSSNEIAVQYLLGG
jgi:hypothetical protein